ncbi:MAG: flagellar assembly protein FliW [Desulfobacterota bacterium]|nr:flagellar assembly protein FliW [Thermodesulfobacteriota bacterium]
MIEIAEDQILHLPDGMIGFPDEKRFVLLKHSEESPFLWFQSVDNGHLAFVVTDPFWFQPDYDFEIDPQEAEVLELKGHPEEVQTLVVVNLHLSNGPPVITANLLGPIVINLRKRLAKQLVLYRSAYSHRHPIPLQSNQKP